MEEAPTGAISRLLGPTRLLRYLTLFAVTLLVAFVLLLAFSDAGGSRDPVEAAITSTSNWRSLWSALYILSAAGLGAAFAGLFKANRELTEGRFDPTKESSYWVTIVLGLIAGVFLAHVLPSDIEALGDLTKPLLALLGGFSAPAVHRVLSRLVETLEALVQGDAQELISARERELRVQAANEIAGARLGLASKLVELEQELANEGITPESRERVTAMLSELLGPEDGQ